MPSTGAVAEISSADVAWLKGLRKEGIGSWDKGNRPLTTAEFERIKKLISNHGMAVELHFDAHDVLFISIYVPPPVIGVRLKSRKDDVLELAYDNYPGFVYAAPNHRAFRDRADKEFSAMAKSPRNRELLELYGLRSPN